MGVFKNGNNWYVDYYVQGRRKRQKVGPSKKQARVVLQKMKVQIAGGKFLDVQRHQTVKFEEMAKSLISNGHRLTWCEERYIYTIPRAESPVT